MKCIGCKKLQFHGDYLLCNETGQVIVSSVEPMEVLRDKGCDPITGRVNGAWYLESGKLRCPVTYKTCKEAGECYKNHCGLIEEVEECYRTF